MAANAGERNVRRRGWRGIPIRQVRKMRCANSKNSDRAPNCSSSRRPLETYSANGGWRWRLIDGTGNELAESSQAYDSRCAVCEGMNAVKEFVPEARGLRGRLTGRPRQPSVRMNAFFTAR